MEFGQLEPKLWVPDTDSSQFRIAKIATIALGNTIFFRPTPKIQSVDLVGQKSVIYYIQMVVVALLSVDLVESVDLVSVYLVVNCINKIGIFSTQIKMMVIY